jgi:peptide/nickel transport system substrate-binding protein
MVPDIETALQLLAQGRVQAVAATTQTNLERRLRRVPGTGVAAGLGSAWWELGFQFPRPGLGDLQVRRAVAAAVDRAGIVEALVRGEGRGLEGLAAGRESQAFAGLRHDPEAARRLMQEAGFTLQGDRFTKAGVSRLEIDAPAENEMAALVQRALEAGLRGAGIDVEVRSPRTERFYASWRREGRFDLAVWERRGTPSMSLRGAYHSAQRPPAGPNYTRVSSPELDRALDAADAAVTGGRSAFEEVMRQLAATIPALPLFEARAYLGYQSGLEGLRPNATVEGPFWNLEQWAKR